MSCATVGCSDPACPVCTVNVRFAVVPCPRFVDGEACKKVAGHYPPCVATVKAGKIERAELKDSKPVEMLRTASITGSIQTMVTIGAVQRVESARRKDTRTIASS